MVFVVEVGVDLQAAGEALYTGDIKNVDGTLYGALALSNRPKADLKLNLDRASAMPGVERIVTAADIPNNTCDGAGAAALLSLLLCDEADVAAFLLLCVAVMELMWLPCCCCDGAGVAALLLSLRCCL